MPGCRLVSRLLARCDGKGAIRARFATINHKRDSSLENPRRIDAAHGVGSIMNVMEAADSIVSSNTTARAIRDVRSRKKSRRVADFR
jgi:hypothetical protein